MRTFEEFALELTSARQKNDRSAVISLCREAAHAYTLPGSQEWYAARYNLGCALMDSTRAITARDIEEAIGLFAELTLHTTANDREGARAACLLGLGRAYYARRAKGGRLRNLRRSARAFLESLEFYTRTREPCTWASVNGMLGKIYFRIGRITGGRALRESVRRYEKALEVFTQAEYPEERTEAEAELDAAKRAASAIGPVGHLRVRVMQPISKSARPILLSVLICLSRSNSAAARASTRKIWMSINISSLALSSCWARRSCAPSAAFRMYSCRPRMISIAVMMVVATFCSPTCSIREATLRWPKWAWVIVSV